MAFTGINWKEEFPNLLAMGKEGKSLKEIGYHYGITPERVRQLYKKFGINPRDVGISLRARLTREQKAAEQFKNKGDPNQELYLEKRAKYHSKKANALRVGTEFSIDFSEIEWPTHCPVLGLALDYLSEGRQENSVSFDRIDPSKGYISGNVIVISWRANRIKNDGTPEEHRKIADFYEKV